MRRAAARGGFSLLEILVALLILTICVSSILALYAVGAASHQRGLENAAAGWVAHQVAAELQGGTPASVTDRPAGPAPPVRPRLHCLNPSCGETWLDLAERVRYEERRSP